MANALCLHERCYSERQYKDIKTAKEQKEEVGLLKEGGIMEHFRSGHGGLVDG
jgi:hypothetical protein